MTSYNMRIIPSVITLFLTRTELDRSTGSEHEDVIDLPKSGQDKRENFSEFDSMIDARVPPIIIS
jgi:hypothetical protein